MSQGGNGGVADSLDEAKAAFRAAVGGAPRRCARPRAGQRPLSWEKADEICEGASRSWRDQPVQVRPR